ncbi:hypothetical protein J5751_01355 [bacterium]|nr:hypothetical protein [bacterium]
MVNITAIGTDNRTQKNHIINHHINIEINIKTALIQSDLFINNGAQILFSITFTTHNINTTTKATQNGLYKIQTTKSNIQVSIGQTYGIKSSNHASNASPTFHGITNQHRHITTKAIHIAMANNKLINNLDLNHTASLEYIFCIFKRFIST